MTHALKFVHASDFHLEQALQGVGELAAPIKPALVNAAYRAAENVFDLAIGEQVDFLLLAGDIVELDEGGPRAATFLLRQFARLADAGIRVFWCSGGVDRPERWPAAAVLPSHVTLFASTALERVAIERGGEPIAAIYGTGRFASRSGFADFRGSAADPYAIVLAHGEFPASGPEVSGVDYWAFGGRHLPRAAETQHGWVVDAGTPQARGLEEAAAFSCALARVDRQRRTEVEAIAVDAVRWVTPTVQFAETASDASIRELLTEQALQLAAELPDQLKLVEWRLVTVGEFQPRLHHERWREETLRWLRSEFGSSERGIWSTGIRFETPPPLPRAWYAEDTLLGDYLREIERLKTDGSEQLSLLSFVPVAVADDSPPAWCRIPAADRREVLDQAARWGAPRLGGGEDDGD